MFVVKFKLNLIRFVSLVLLLQKVVRSRLLESVFETNCVYVLQAFSLKSIKSHIVLDMFLFFFKKNNLFIQIFFGNFFVLLSFSFINE